MQELVATQFQGEFRGFREAVFEFSVHRAERAALELALLFRYLDDELHLSDTYSQVSSTPFGYVNLVDGTTDVLSLREAMNKIIHAESFGWNTEKPTRPLLVCEARAGDIGARKPWKRADVEILKICVACGSLL